MSISIIIAGLWTAIGSIPGCTFVEAKDTVSGKKERWDISFKGWSPSLHETIVKVHVLVDKRISDREKLKEIVYLLEDVLERQRYYSSQGLKMFSALPLCMPESIANIEKIQIEHLYADASSLAFRICNNQEKGNMDWEGISYEYKQVVREIHQRQDTGSSYDGGDVFGIGGNYIALIDGKCLVETRTYFTSLNQQQMVMEGRELSIPNCLPETVLSGMVGKRLGDAIEISPYLHDRKVEYVDVTEDVTNIFLEPCMVSLLDIADTDQEQALHIVLEKLATIG